MKFKALNHCDTKLFDVAYRRTLPTTRPPRSRVVNKLNNYAVAQWRCSLFSTTQREGTETRPMQWRLQLFCPGVASGEAS